MAQITVKAPDGVLYDIEESQLTPELQEKGYAKADDKQIALYDAELRADENQVLEGTKAGALGLARSASFGLSDVLLSESGLMQKEDIDAIRQANPKSNLAGEVGGLFVPGSLVGKAVRTTGKVAERAAQKYLTKTGIGQAERSLAKKVTEFVAKEAGENATFGLQQGLSEVYLGEPENVGETLAAYTGLSILFGIPIGGAMSVIGKTASEIAKKSASLAGSMDLKKLGIEATIKSQSGGSATKVIKDALKKDEKRFGTEFVPKLEELADQVKKNARQAEDASGQLVGEVDEKTALKNMADQGYMYDVALKNKKKNGEALNLEYSQLKDTPISSKAISDPGEKIYTEMNKSVGVETKEQAQKFKKLLDNINETYGETVVETIETVSKKGKKTIQEVEVKRLPENMTIFQLWEIRKQIDDEIGPRGFFGEVSPYKEALKQYRHQISKNLLDEVAKIAPENASRIRMLNKEYDNNTWILDMARDAAAKEANKTGLTFWDLVSGAGGIIATANPFVGLAAIAAKKGIEKYQNPLLSILLDKNGPVLAGVNKVYSEGSQNLKGGIKDFIINGAKKTGDTVKFGSVSLLTGQAEKDKVKAYKENIELLQNAKNDPEQAINNLSDKMADLNDLAPQIAQATQAALFRGLQFLISKMPQTAPATMFNQDIRLPSEMELAEFNRYVRAVNNPMTVVEDLQRGELTSEGVEVLREVYPSIYEELKQTVIEFIQENPKMSYKDRLQISTLMGMAVDDYTDGKFLLEMQNNYVVENQQEQTGALKKANMKPLDNLTDIERLSNK